jgi:sugar/nucleoside kinase (ribokinase family)
MYDILVAGEINPDLILTGDIKPIYGQAEQLIESADLTVGSSSAIFACGAARLGFKVAFIGVCGDDLFGRFMLDSMRTRGVETSSIHTNPELRTGISVILNRESDRSILTFPGTMSALESAQVTDELLSSAKHLHVASYFLQTALQPGLPDLFRRARQLGLTTSLDTNIDPVGEWKGVKDIFEYTNIFLPNATEASAIAGNPDPTIAAAKLNKLVEIVAIKLGAQGALGAIEGKIISVPAITVRIVDTVGAGDSFNAGFIYGYLHGWDIERSLRLGVVCGGLSTQAAGGIEAQPTIQQALALI